MYLCVRACVCVSVFEDVWTCMYAWMCVRMRVRMCVCVSVSVTREDDQGEARAKLERGPVKRPDRALQKVVRKFYRDPRCLTDLIRCSILVDSIRDVKLVLAEILRKSIVGLSIPVEEVKLIKLRTGEVDETANLPSRVGARVMEASVSLETDLRKNKTDFTEQEWEVNGIPDLQPGDLIKSGDCYYKPIKKEKKDELVEILLGTNSAASQVGTSRADGLNGEPGSPKAATEEEGQRLFNRPLKVFKLCKFKDRFAKEPDNPDIGYRDLCLGLEVGWKMESEASDTLDFVDPRDFSRPGSASHPSISPYMCVPPFQPFSLLPCSLFLRCSLALTRAYGTTLSGPGVRTHICEVQILLKSMNEIKIKDGHKRFVAARNLLSQ